MSAEKHTPTPWHTDTLCTNEIWAGSTPDDIRRIAVFHDLGRYGGDETDVANAEFITAAVNTYDERDLVLRECLAAFSDTEDELGRAMFKRIEKLLHRPVANTLAAGSGR